MKLAKQEASICVFTFCSLLGGFPVHPALAGGITYTCHSSVCVAEQEWITWTRHFCPYYFFSNIWNTSPAYFHYFQLKISCYVPTTSLTPRPEVVSRFCTPELMLFMQFIGLTFLYCEFFFLLYAFYSPAIL